MKPLLLLLAVLLPCTRACQNSACGQTNYMSRPASMAGIDELKDVNKTRGLGLDIKPDTSYVTQQFLNRFEELKAKEKKYDAMVSQQASLSASQQTQSQPTVQYTYGSVTTAPSPQQTTIVEGPPVITYAPAPQPMYVNYAPQPTYYAAPCSSCPSGACANGQCGLYGCPSGQCFGGQCVGGACANGQCSGGSCQLSGGW